MLQPDVRLLGPIIDDVLAQTSVALTGGLSPEQSEWTVAAYRGTVLPYILRFAAAEGDELRNRRVAVVVDDILAGLAPLGPDEKWAAVRRAYYFSLLLPLSEEAFGLAQQVYRGERTREELRSSAEEIRGQVQMLTQALEQYPDTREGLLDAVSETMLDCRYVLEETRITSLRLGRVMQRQPRSGACPGCGATNQPGSRFCSQCGARLEA